MNTEQLPIAIIGAGPVGLAAAAHLITRGETPVVLEAGPTVGANILAWGHVRIFSPWRYNIDSAARTLLDAASWQAPNADEIPTGRELVERYLAPLAALPRLAPHIRLGHRVLGITPGLFHVVTIGPSEAGSHMIGLLIPHMQGGCRWSSFSIAECWNASRTCRIHALGPIGFIPGNCSGR